IVSTVLLQPRATLRNRRQQRRRSPDSNQLAATASRRPTSRTSAFSDPAITNRPATNCSASRFETLQTTIRMLERQLQPELNQPRIIARRIDLANSWRGNLRPREPELG